jgi:hypothetical protein
MYIKHAAIKYPNGEVVSGFDRHYKIIALQAKLGIATKDGCEQGFVDGMDNFLTREEAKAVAIAAGQIPKDHEGLLYSEDIWKPPVGVEV